MGFFRSLFGKTSNNDSNEMKFLIAGLGNPGAEYAGTRHNIGFMVLDKMAADKELAWESNRLGHTLTYRFRGKQLIFLKPNTYMNLSGKAIRYHLQQNGITPKELLVITDDLSLPFGKVRMKARGSSGGHNGLTNIEELLGTQDYPRLRFGIGSEFSRGAQVDYVLSPFTTTEQEGLTALLDKCRDAVFAFATEGIDRAMNKYN